jgi:NH3-dependent NAD+ synthetase
MTNCGQRVARVKVFLRCRRDQAQSHQVVLGLAGGEEAAGVLEVGLGARKELRIFWMGDPMEAVVVDAGRLGGPEMGRKAFGRPE